MKITMKELAKLKQEAKNADPRIWNAWKYLQVGKYTKSMFLSKPLYFKSNIPFNPGILLGNLMMSGSEHYYFFSEYELKANHKGQLFAHNDKAKELWGKEELPFPKPLNASLPAPGIPVLLEQNGKYIRACHYPENYLADEFDSEVETTYSEKLDRFFLAEGWYELCENGDDYSSWRVPEIDNPHWIPMPSLVDHSPKEAARQLENLENALVENIIQTSDEEILKEVEEEHGDPLHDANLMKGIYEKAKKQVASNKEETEE